MRRVFELCSLKASQTDSGLFPVKPDMVERGTSPRPSPHLTPLPLSNAEREKRSQRLGGIQRRLPYCVKA